MYKNKNADLDMVAQTIEAPTPKVELPPHQSGTQTYQTEVILTEVPVTLNQDGTASYQAGESPYQGGAPPPYQTGVPLNPAGILPPQQQPPIQQSLYAFNNNPHYMSVAKENHYTVRSLSIHLGVEPVAMTCPSCQSVVTTETKVVYGTGQWMVAFILCCLLLFVFVWIPFMFKNLKDTIHTCPRCKGYCGFQRWFLLGAK